MRDWILGVAILIGSVAITWALLKNADRSRYTAAPAGDVIAVLDTHTGQLQTFQKGPDVKHFIYVGADSRRSALERTKQPTK
jgi:hypothetical protein